MIEQLKQHALEVAAYRGHRLQGLETSHRAQCAHCGLQVLIVADQHLVTGLALAENCNGD